MGPASEAEGTGCRGAGEDPGASATAGRAPAEMRTQLLRCRGRRLGDSDADGLAGGSARCAGSGGPGFQAEPVRDPDRGQVPGAPHLPGRQRKMRRDGVKDKGDKYFQRAPGGPPPGPRLCRAGRGLRVMAAGVIPHLWGGNSSVPGEVRSQPPMVGHDLIASGRQARSFSSAMATPAGPPGASQPLTTRPPPLRGPTSG